MSRSIPLYPNAIGSLGATYSASNGPILLRKKLKQNLPSKTVFTNGDSEAVSIGRKDPTDHIIYLLEQNGVAFELFASTQSGPTSKSLPP